MTMNLEAMSDKAVLGELGGRLHRDRLNRNLTQADLASKAGVSRRSLQNFERGQPASLTTLIKVLRAMGNLAALDAFFPETGISPVQLAKLKGRERRRATGSSRRRDKTD